MKSQNVTSSKEHQDLTITTDISREVTEGDIEVSRNKALSQNAEMIMILNYGIQWYIPN